MSLSVEEWMKSDKPTEQILEEFMWLGFSAGFRGMPGESVSNFFEPQTSYLEGYTKGRKMLDRIKEVAQKEYPDDPMGMNKIMNKAFEYYDANRNNVV